MTYRSPRYDPDNDGEIDANTHLFGGNGPGWYAGIDNVIDKKSQAEILNYGFETGEPGVPSVPQGWLFNQLLDGRSTNGIFYNQTPPNGSDSTQSFGSDSYQNSTTGLGMGLWSLSRWFSLATVGDTLTLNLWVRGSHGSDPTGTSFVSGEETFLGEEDAFVETTFYDSNENEISVAPNVQYSTTARHQAWQRDGYTNLAFNWSLLEHTPVVPTGAEFVEVKIQTADGNGTIRPLGDSGGGNAGVLLDDFSISYPTGVGEIRFPPNGFDPFDTYAKPSDLYTDTQARDALNGTSPLFTVPRLSNNESPEVNVVDGGLLHDAGDGATGLAGLYYGNGGSWHRVWTEGNFDPGNLQAKYTPTAISSSYTANDREIVLADASAGALTVTLPPPASGAMVTVKKTDSANDVTVSQNGSETIDGSATESLINQYEVVEFASDGTNWYII